MLAKHVSCSQGYSECGELLTTSLQQKVGTCWIHLTTPCCYFLLASSHKSQLPVPLHTNLFQNLGLSWPNTIWSLITGFTTSTFSQINLTEWTAWRPVHRLGQYDDISTRLPLSSPCVQAEMVLSIPNFHLPSVPLYKSNIPSKLVSPLGNGFS